MKMMISMMLVMMMIQVTSSSKPNIVLLVLDDIGYADVGFHGSNFPTPNIDRLVSEGTEMTHMYAMPQCSPTRSAIMTGRFAFHTVRSVRAY